MLARVIALSWLAFFLVLAACVEKPPATEAGSIALRLVAESGGQTYRLRSATFVITGPESIELSSETDPDASTLTTTLPIGEYSIELQDGWYIERLDAAGNERVNGVLLNTGGSFEIRAGQTTALQFIFTIAGEQVTFEGTLEISISVVPQCDLLAQTGCSGSLACYPRTTLQPVVAVCASVPGFPRALGEQCSASNHCQAGVACHEGICKQLCDVLAASCSCTPLGIESAGVCEP